MSRGGDLHGEEEKKRQREREREHSTGPGFYFWVVYLFTSQWFPAPNPCCRFMLNEEDVRRRRKSLAHYSAASHFRLCFSHLSALY